MMPERSCDVFHQIRTFDACAQVEQNAADIELRFLGNVRHRGFDHAVQHIDQFGDFRAHLDVVGQSESSMECVATTMVDQAGAYASADQKYASCAPAQAVEPTCSPFPNKE